VCGDSGGGGIHVACITSHTRRSLWASRASRTSRTGRSLWASGTRGARGSLGPLRASRVPGDDLCSLYARR